LTGGLFIPGRLLRAPYFWENWLGLFPAYFPPFPNNSASADRATSATTTHQREGGGQMEKRLSGGHPWGGQSQCASPAREDRGNLTRPVATNSGTNVNVQTPRRRSQQHIPKSRKENPSLLDPATRARTTGAQPARDLDGVFICPLGHGRRQHPPCLHCVQTMSHRWPHFGRMLSGFCPSPVSSASSETRKLA
jgi:hypothetical protein